MLRIWCVSLFWDGDNIGVVLSPHDVNLIIPVKAVKVREKVGNGLLLLCITVLTHLDVTNTSSRVRLRLGGWGVLVIAVGRKAIVEESKEVFLLL
jgi:hypothetical protein